MILIHCRRCKIELGAIVGGRLVVGACVFERTVTFTCTCGKRRQWMPVRVLAGVAGRVGA